MNGHTPDPEWVFLFPTEASTTAERVDDLFLLLLGVTGVAVVGVVVLLVYFSVRYQHRRAVDRSNRPRGKKARYAEITWSLIPLFIFVGFFAWGSTVYVDIQRMPPDALEINAIAKQWMWKFQHPDGQREINELHVPVGMPVRLTMTSQDVIHSFYVPAFRVKQDLLPGTYTRTWFEATKTGTYHLFCAEYCGTEHSQMRGKIIVMEPARYEAWLTRQAPEGTLAAAGEGHFRRLGCSGCHAVRSTVHAPSLSGIYERVIHLEDGVTKVADEAYLRDSILLPRKDIVVGYPPIMPSFKGQVSEGEILELIAYLKSLQDDEVIIP